MVPVVAAGVVAAGVNYATTDRSPGAACPTGTYQDANASGHITASLQLNTDTPIEFEGNAASVIHQLCHYIVNDKDIVNTAAVVRGLSVPHIIDLLKSIEVTDYSLINVITDYAVPESSIISRTAGGGYEIHFPVSQAEALVQAAGFFGQTITISADTSENPLPTISITASGYVEASAPANPALDEAMKAWVNKIMQDGPLPIYGTTAYVSPVPETAGKVNQMRFAATPGTLASDVVAQDLNAMGIRRVSLVPKRE